MHKFYPQHKEKCYCIKGCVCENVQVPEKTHPKFIKICTETGNIRPSCERLSISGPSSSKTASSIKSGHQSTSNSQFEKCSNSTSSSELTLTNRRLSYEQNQTISMYNVLSDAPTTTDDYDYRNYLSDMDIDQVKKLNEFRLQNAQECFSILSNHSVSQRLADYNKNPVGHTCEFVYQLNSRGILTPLNVIENDGRPLCAVCKQQRTKDLPEVVPLESSGKPHKVILQIQDIKGQQPFKIMNNLRTQNAVGNSLALRYQKLA